MKEIKVNRTERLPVLALLALAMTGFICILTETIPAGLLPGISAGLNISPSVAGQMVTAYAAGSLVAAIPLTIMTRTWSRRSVLLATVCGFLLFNSLTALSDSVTVIMCARFLAGAAAGLAWSLIAGYARRMVAPSLQGRALTLAMIGTPVALSFGVPAGTWLGDLLGWRLTFAVMSALSVMLMAWIILAVPDYPGQTIKQKIRLTSVLLIPGIRPILGVVLSWMIAHNILYTYVAPFLSLSGLSSNVDVVLLVFGLAAMVGIFITGKVVDSALRMAVLLSLSVFTLVSIIFGISPTSPVVIYPGIAAWGLTFGGAATLLQTALADTAGEHADIALSMNVVTWNSAIALGGLTGGLLLRHEGASSLPWALVALLIVALIIVFRARSHGFPAGKRPS
ncbi:MFS transporter [Klebsiella pneumoniae]|uniref:MFS transporter n=1 Tax=Klebsiella pneumoniae TaxID=573 RepID=A0A9J6S6I1_KLEPN|nr:MFS transporter [Klebsiella pneumoniae]MRL38666.1 MFS transporter [Klebsiella pneumoniae]SSF99435.1 Putative arabinose efflux permease [Klebsiella pneumoniae]HBU8514087.1 MFS transporter [Klebsiella pneumoniae]HBU9927294.1 MFS transporter [Klebsiella pneumoniae]HBV5097547.1 MFS transporter [Klebsiella pneumoniae]